MNLVVKAAATGALKAMQLHRELFVFAGTCAAAAVGGLLVVAGNEHTGPLARPEFALLTTLPVVVYPALGAILVAAVLVRRHWWIGTALFFAWMPLEDLARKFTGNDLRLYFVKDAILVVAFVGALPKLEGCWRKVLAETHRPLVVVLAVAAVMSAPAAVIDPKLPVIALHTRFLFAAMLPIGAFIGSDRKRLEDAFFYLSIFAAAICALGIVQAIVGPTFLNPALDTSPFAHLTVERSAGAATVLRPSGPFADVSRFASMTIIAVVLTLCASRLANTRFRRRWAYACLTIAILAVFASASRAALLTATPIAAFGLSRGAGGRFRLRTILGAALAALALALVGGRIGDVYRSTSDFFAGTINPFSKHFELASRASSYVRAIIDGVAGGHWLGTGTGTESVGKRYLTTAFESTNTESGWGSIGAEWGLLGLALWCSWTIAWLRRAFRFPRPGHAASNDVRLIIAVYLATFLVALFSLGIGLFENYVANAFFWFFSGVAFTLASPTPENQEKRDERDVPGKRWRPALLPA